MEMSIINPVKHDVLILSVATGIFLAVCVSRRFTPESSRYLLLKGRVTETEQILRQIATTNKKEYPEEPLLDLNAEGKVQALGDFRDLFRTKTMLHRTLVSWYAW